MADSFEEECFFQATISDNYMGGGNMEVPINNDYMDADKNNAIDAEDFLEDLDQKDIFTQS